jgi:hypothetical protein
VIADIHNQTNTMLHTNVNLVFQKYSLTVAEKFITEPISRDSRVEVLRKDKEKFRSARKIMRSGKPALWQDKYGEKTELEVVQSFLKTLAKAYKRLLSAPLSREAWRERFKKLFVQFVLHVHVSFIRSCSIEYNLIFHLSN